MKNYQVARTNLSPYQNPNFLSQEKSIIESFPQLDYLELENLGNSDTILITNTHTQLKKIPSDILNRTKLIIHPNSGYDHFHDEKDLWEKIPIIIGHTIRAQAVAEYCLRALFEGLNKLPIHGSWDQDRKWQRTLLKDTSVWIFGYGHIGKIIADTLSALGLEIIIVDPFIEFCPHRLLKDVKDGPIKNARVIISTMSLNKTNYHYFNKNFFQDLGKEILFINAARGKLVEEEALKNYLSNHPNSSAFLDVFEKEPFGKEWQDFPQVRKTSHIAGVDKKIDDRILNFEKNVLNDFLSNEESVFLKIYEKELIQNKWIEGVLI